MLRAKVTSDTNIWVCQDCMIGNVNEGERLDYVVNGGRFACETTPNFDSETGEGIEEWVTSPCQGCGEHLAGDRYRFMVWAWLS